MDVKKTGADLEKLFYKELPHRLEDYFTKFLFKEAAIAGRLLNKSAKYKLKKHPTGVLARSFLPPSFVRTSDGGLGAAAMSRLPYAGIHETGGEIRPKTAKALTIPIANVARNRKARSFKDTFIWKSKGGKAYIARTKGKKQKLELLYALRKSAKIKGTGYITLANRALQKYIVRDTEVGIGGVIVDAAKGSSRG